MKTYVVLSDIQAPFHDPKALELALAFVEGTKPTGVVLAGDIADCYSLSSFDKSPLTSATLDLEISLTRDLMAGLAKVAKDRVFLGGRGRSSKLARASAAPAADDPVFRRKHHSTGPV